MLIQQIIEEKLQKAFSPDYCQVINESHKHNVPDGSESHFKLVLVSHEFDSLRLIQRQQCVYKTLEEEIAGSVHALTMQTLTPEEWQQNQTITSSPDCMGGSNNT